MDASLKFLNVDVEIFRPVGDRVFVNYFKQNANILQDDADLLSFESLSTYDDADSCIASLAYLIRSMPSNLRLLWSHSAARYFDVGYESDLGRHSVAAEISSASLQAMGEIGVQLRVTIYAGR